MLKLLVINTFRTDNNPKLPSYEVQNTELLQPQEGETQEAYQARAEQIVSDFNQKFVMDEDDMRVCKEFDDASLYKLVDGKWEFIG